MRLSLSRALFPAAVLGLALVLAACNSSSSPSTPTLCNTGTFEQLASPTAGQTGVSTTIGQVIIVADGSANTLYNTHSQWNILITNSATGSIFTGGALNLVSDPSGPHPYPSDFYYASSIQQLTAGQTYTASLSLASGSCQSIGLGSFST